MFPFGKDVFMPGEESVQVKPKILNFFCLGRLLVADANPRTYCCMSGKGDVGGFRAIGFQPPLGNPVLNSKETGL
jgi:hypothetical protein